jgi:hypothetical protein
METSNLPAIRALRPAWNKGRIVGQKEAPCCLSPRLHNRKTGRCPERPLSSRYPFDFAHAAKVSFPPLTAI